MNASFARALVCAFPCVAMAQIAVLQIKVLEGDGAVHQAGVHITHPLTVEVTDENGRPVPSAAVSFQLPPDGPGGLFSNGLRTDLVVTDANGRAALHALQLNRTGGQFRIRITAVKEQARAGIVSLQYIGGDLVAAPAAAAKPAAQGITANSSPAASAPAPAIKSGEITRTTTKMSSGGHKKWIIIAAVAVGGAVAFLGVSRKSKSSSTSTVSSSTVSIGSPVITVGQP
jgi:hypothetical protein